MESIGLHGLIEIALVILWLLLIWLLLTRRKKNGDTGGEPPMPPTGTKKVSIGLNAATGRWQLSGAGGEIAPPLVARPGEVVTWENSTPAQVDIQFPNDSLFELAGAPNSGGQPIDPWVVTVPAGGTLRLSVSRKAQYGTYEYAFWVRGPESVTGYAVGGSPPRIIVHKA